MVIISFAFTLSIEIAPKYSSLFDRQSRLSISIAKKTMKLIPAVVALHCVAIEMALDYISWPNIVQLASDNWLWPIGLLTSSTQLNLQYVAS